MIRTRQEIIARGQQAAALLESSILNEVLDAVEAKLRASWLDGTTVEAREAAWAKTHALAELKIELRSIIDDGEYARNEILRPT